MYNCNNCGKKVRGDRFYCYDCKQKEDKKMKQRTKVNEKRRLESEVSKFEAYLKSGRRTY